MILAHPKGNDHVRLDFGDFNERTLQAFKLGGHGKLTNLTLDDVALHRSVNVAHATTNRGYLPASPLQALSQALVSFPAVLIQPLINSLGVAVIAN